MIIGGHDFYARGVIHTKVEAQQVFKQENAEGFDLVEIVRVATRIHCGGARAARSAAPLLDRHRQGADHQRNGDPDRDWGFRQIANPVSDGGIAAGSVCGSMGALPGSTAPARP
ncbi:hypothetical protein [Mycobacterium spongiae]|uniref:Uncharacterized protein n=1 Tax=Mycobacterium spongiae TaxID=886343 RepID=A0A975K163_9MYCO|nr:hypothetical protein [Mycobacterium spongiae]QUR69050.1 hypothetical protein F6B93_20025 [Mycobacterium spongiae]